MVKYLCNLQHQITICNYQSNAYSLNIKHQRCQLEFTLQLFIYIFKTIKNSFRKDSFEKETFQ